MEGKGVQEAMNLSDTMRCLILLFFFLLAANITVAGQHEHKIEPHRHSDLAKMKNPVPMTEESIGKGREIFEKHCILCHGRLVKEEKRLDLADDKWIHGDTDGEIFHVITNGIKGTTMTSYKKELSSEMRWHLVNYIKSLGKEKKGE